MPAPNPPRDPEAAGFRFSPRGLSLGLTLPKDTPRPSLPEPLIRRKRRTSRWTLLVGFVLGCAIVAAIVAVGRHDGAPSPRYLTATISRGALAESVRATGTIQPMSQVQVGAQVSGRIASVRVDYNTRVHAGDLLAEIDPVPYRAQVAQNRAGVMSARAQLAQNAANAVLAEQTLMRQLSLREQGINSPAELDTAVASTASARAAVQVATAAVAQAQAVLAVGLANLNYTRILAPISGTVASRSVDPGQTVAASFQTPTLFVIANDLARMQVIANVDEANVGRLREGMVALVRVDAFSRDAFQGTVNQLRISPTTSDGVVTYQAVVGMFNPTGRLRPGMTATIRVITAQRSAVLRVPNAALRYRPVAGSTPPPPGDRATAAETFRGQSSGALVYLERGGAPVAVPIRLGITDGASTEIEGADVEAGELVIIDETDAVAKPRGPGGPRMF